MREVEIRPVTRLDRKAVISITYRTGLFGEDHTGKGLIPDKLLYSYLYSWYYVTYEPENCFVAVVDGDIAGYIIGTDDTKRQRLRFRDLMIPKIYRRLTYLRRFGMLYDDNYSHWVSHSLHEEIMSYHQPLPDGEDQYPSHLHINVLPGYQRLGIGSGLMNAFRERMEAAGAAGIHLVTTTLNEKAVPFYEKQGYTELKRIPFDASWAGFGEAEAVVFGCEL